MDEQQQNSKHSRDLSQAFSETCSSDLSSISTDLSEFTLDSILEDGPLRDLPIVGQLKSIWNLGANVRDWLFTKKLITFLDEIKQVPPEERRRMLELLDDASKQERAGERLLSLLDRIDRVAKAQLMGRAFSLLVEQVISAEEFWRIAFIIDRLPLDDLLALKHWKESDANSIGEIQRHLYLSVGLACIMGHGAFVDFTWQSRLCTIISDNLLEN